MIYYNLIFKYYIFKIKKTKKNTTNKIRIVQNHSILIFDCLLGLYIFAIMNVCVTKKNKNCTSIFLYRLIQEDLIRQFVFVIYHTIRNIIKTRRSIINE